MKRRGFFKRALLATAGLGAIGGTTGALVACGSTSLAITKIFGPNYTFTYDSISRAYMAARAYSIDSSDYATIKPAFTLADITSRFKSILKDANDTTTPNDDDSAMFVYRMVQAIRSYNTDNVVAWRDPSSTNLTQADERYVVYLEGGPIGDVCQEIVDNVNSIPYSREFYLNESQYGFVPSVVARTAGSTSAKNTYFTDFKTSSDLQLSAFKNSFDKNLLDQYGYLRLIGGNATYDEPTTLSLTSIAFSMVTADRAAVLVENLTRQTTHVFVIGESYGMHVGLELLTQHPEVLPFVEKAELGRNVLAPGGGTHVAPVDNNGDGIDDSTVTYGDGVLIQSVSYYGIEKGYIDRLTAAISAHPAAGTTESFLDQLRSKVTFGFSTADATIGALPKEDQAFYDANKIIPNIETGGHNAFSLEDWKNLVGATNADYDYSGLSTVISGRPRGCLRS